MREKIRSEKKGGVGLCGVGWGREERAINKTGLNVLPFLIIALF